MVCKGVSPPPPPFQNHPTITRIPPILKIPPHLTGKLVIPSFPYQQKCNCEIKFNKFTLKYMLGDVYVNKIHARQCLYIISSICRGFPNPFNFLVVSKGIHHVQLFWTARKKRFFNFSMEQLPIDSYMLLHKQKNSI